LVQGNNPIRLAVDDHTRAREGVDALAWCPFELLIKGLDDVHGVAWREGGREGRV